MSNTADKFSAVAQLAAVVSNAAVNAAQGRAEACYLAIGAAAGTLTMLAYTIGGNDDISQRTHSDVMLFAALLVSECVTPERDKCRIENGHTVIACQACEFSPEVVFNAMVAFEKLTGRRPDSVLDKNLVRFARESQDSGAVVLTDFLAKRATNGGTDTTH